MLAGLMNRQQQQVIEYLQEVRVLKELHGNKWLKFTDRQRARLAHSLIQTLERLGGLLKSYHLAPDTKGPEEVCHAA